MNDNSEKSTSGLIDLIEGLSIPEWITKNAITAIGKGIHGVIGEAFEIPKNALKNYNERVKLIGELKREYVKKAAQHPLKQIESDPDLASRILSSYSSKLFEEQLNKESIALKTVEKLSGADFSSTAPTGDEIGYD